MTCTIFSFGGPGKIIMEHFDSPAAFRRKYGASTLRQRRKAVLVEIQASINVARHRVQDEYGYKDIPQLERIKAYAFAQAFELLK